MCVGHPWHCSFSSIFSSYTENDFCHSFLLMIQYDIGVKHLSLTRLFIFSGVASLIFLLKEVIKLANYGLELRKSAFDTGQKCCTFDVQNSAYNLYHVIDPQLFFFSSKCDVFSLLLDQFSNHIWSRWDHYLISPLCWANQDAGNLGLNKFSTCVFL